jgi:hypothetical protein
MVYKDMTLHQITEIYTELIGVSRDITSRFRTSHPFVGIIK